VILIGIGMGVFTYARGSRAASRQDDIAAFDDPPNDAAVCELATPVVERFDCVVWLVENTPPVPIATTANVIDLAPKTSPPEEAVPSLLL
jgi:hypothetical protein